MDVILSYAIDPFGTNQQAIGARVNRYHCLLEILLGGSKFTHLPDCIITKWL